MGRRLRWRAGACGALGSRDAPCCLPLFASVISGIRLSFSRRSDIAVMGIAMPLSALFMFYSKSDIIFLLLSDSKMDWSD